MGDAALFPIGLSVEQARARVVEVASARRCALESVALDAALGRVLAEDVIAPHDVPPFANSAMDGFAVRGSDLGAAGDVTLRLVGQILAGGSHAPEVVAGTCVRITTGAVLPRGADTVVMKENVREEGDAIHIQSGTPAGANVRPAGEDYRRGDSALKAGMHLSPARVAALASFGRTHARVAARPRAALLTTGDELTAPGQPLQDGRIYDSNRYSLGGLLEQHGVEMMRHERVRDDPVALRDSLLRAGAEADIILSSGGVSAGEADYLPGILAAIGEVYFWKVRIKPGMPFLFGRVGGALLFALPGNPVSGIATFLTLVRPALHAMTGAMEPESTLRVRLRQPLRKRHARAEFQRATLECDMDGVLWATVLARQGSGMLRGVAEADALIVIPEGEQQFDAGHVVVALPLPGWPA
jgi:molybdopterin molybdotransferase